MERDFSRCQTSDFAVFDEGWRTWCGMRDVSKLNDTRSEKKEMEVRIFLHDDNFHPLGIVTIDWDVERCGPWIRIPVFMPMNAGTYSGSEIAHLAQTMDGHIMEIHLSPLRYKKKTGEVSEGWIGSTTTPDLCKTFFKTKFGKYALDKA